MLEKLEHIAGKGEAEPLLFFLITALARDGLGGLLNPLFYIAKIGFITLLNPLG